jgi:hypothetical protein
MLVEILEEELSVLLDFLAEAGAKDELPSKLLPYFWRLSATYYQLEYGSGPSEVSE